MANLNLHKAKIAKNDEFYTQYSDIQKEIDAYTDYNPDVFRGKTVLCPCDDPEWSNFTKFFAQNFDRFGLKKLISTSYAYDSKNPKPVFDWQPTIFELDNPEYDAEKSPKKGKIFTLTDQEEPPRDINKLQWHYLEGDGDFRSEEVTKLLKESDIVITNPPFSLFREFIAWVFGENKKFIVIGNKNCVTYKEIFPLIKENKLWSGKTEWAGGLWFETPDPDDVDKIVDGIMMKNVSSVWFTNVEHGRRHEPLMLLSEKDNIKYSRHKEIKHIGYKKYDNYDVIEVPFYDAIPSDYAGVMGVPVSFLDKYCPEQFEIIGMESSAGYDAKIVGMPKLKDGDARPAIDGKTTYARIFIRHKHPKEK